MSRLVIKDLSDSIDLDREAMTSIVGGAHVRGQVNPAQVAPRTTRVVDYPDTLPRTQPASDAPARHGKHPR
jgi:hypothetical protein